MRLHIDIETIGSTDPAVREQIAAGIKPPGNYKKAETIAAWERDEKPALVDEAMAKTAFDGASGRIVCIGYAFDDEAPVANCSGDERALLINFFAAVEQHRAERRKDGAKVALQATVIGHNLANFDLRFIWKRCVVLGIRPPLCIPFKVKPWDEAIFDTMAQWDAMNKISLDALCRALGVPSSKGDMDGSKVWAAYNAGEFLKIATYCAGDVEAVRQIHQRMTFAVELPVLQAAA